ncbi:Ger(x)C family spore germination protein [Bacillus sp. EAC]|uniref:Ger(x)C family spore germination protein n=1 Tax=Bacillus sp. EAC TaxID=1978338 RepID=UPI000B42F35F|nr:Ger(x)C family spore germination protein [Bacillus sp. EAC]
MKRMILITITSLICLLVGCWDQSLLINKKFVNGVSFDLTDEDKILGTVRALTIQNKGGGLFDVKDEIVEATRPALTGIQLDLNNKLPGQIDASKAYVILIGQELAKNGIHPFLDIFYRNKNAYVASRVVITKGKASELLALEPETSPIAFVILKGLLSAEISSKIPKETVFTAWTKIVDPGQDIVLPSIDKDKSNKIIIGGINLFDGDKFTGISLTGKDSSLLLLLMNRLEKVSEIALYLDKKRGASFYVTSLKRDLKVKVNKSTNKIISKVNLKLHITLVNYSNNPNKNINPNENINIDKLNKEISAELTKQAKVVTDSLIEANCDALGVGRKLASTHPDLWKKLKWKKEYKNVQFETKVKVIIDKTGSVF